MRERISVLYSTDSEQINRVMRGIEPFPSFSTFIDASDLKDSSDKSWLSDEAESERDYTEFGEMRKLNF